MFPLALILLGLAFYSLSKAAAKKGGSAGKARPNPPQAAKTAAPVPDSRPASPPVSPEPFRTFRSAESAPSSPGEGVPRKAAPASVLKGESGAAPQPEGNPLFSSESSAEPRDWVKAVIMSEVLKRPCERRRFPYGR